MIVEKDKKLIGKVKFEKGSLSLAFPNTTLSQIDIQEQLDLFKTTGNMELMNPNFTFNVKKEGDMFNVSLTRPTTKTITISKSDVSKVEEMLYELAGLCTGTSIADSHSSTNLLINESPR